MLDFKDWPDAYLQSIRSPALIIIGDADMDRPEHAVAMHRLMPNSRLAILPGGHGAYLGEITTLSNGQWTAADATAMIQRFLSE